MSQGCGGTLVGSKYVVTAAHCTDGLSPADLMIRVGDTTLAEEWEATSFTYGVAAIKNHPNYDTSTLANDIAVVELDSDVPLDMYPHIKPACLPEAGALFPGSAVVSGWGTVSSGGNTNSWLHEVNLTVFADGNCGSMNSVMTDDMLCAGLMEGGKDACQGDSGGPLVASDPMKYGAMSLIGVVSWGYGCAGADALGIYSEVSHFTDWLDQQMPGLQTCPPYASGTLPPSTTPSTTPAPTTTTEPAPECENGRYPKALKPYRKIKKVKRWTQCRDSCNDDDRCEYFKWKNHKKWQKRMCFLMEVTWQASNTWVSGEKFCG